ncbi:MAG: hypothetical protein K9G61_02110, partial [Bacteroidales bacterium]|nr:hypothetical protein [Bacteroidales bacterium]
MHLEETNSQVLDSSGDGLPLTGDKFYTENGQLLWDTGMEGEPNRVFVISDDKMKGYLAKMNLYASWVNAGYHQLAYSRKVGTEVNTIITDDALFIYPKSSWKDITAAIHFMGEGFAAGYLKGSYYQNQGLADHYSKLFGASGYWKNYYKAKEFSPWWL